MSTAGGPDLGEPLSHSIEKDKPASQPKDKHSVTDETDSISRDVYGSMAAELKAKTNLELSASKISSASALRSPIEFSKPYGRINSPVAESYETFLPPPNDLHGYYAKAIRRREAGSASPQPGRRIAPRIAQSPPYVPRNPFQDDMGPEARRKSSGFNAGQEQDLMDIDEQIPQRYPSPRFPAYEGFSSGSDSSKQAGSRGQSIQRKSVVERRKQSQPDPHVSVDDDTEQYEDEDDQYAYGAREEYSSNSRMMNPIHRRESHAIQARRSRLEKETFLKHNEDVEDKFSQRHQSRLSRGPQSYGRADGDVEDSFGSRQDPRSERPRRPAATDKEGFGQSRKSQNDGFRRPREPAGNDDEESLFVPGELPRRLIAPMMQEGTGNGGRGGRGGLGQKTFSHETLVNVEDRIARSPAPPSKRRKFTEDNSAFNQPGAALAPSRYSGDPSVNWGLNQDPPSVPQASVSDAALLKRGLTRGAKDKVCKRGYGANDPENVNIVNMKEDGMSFAEIVETLNEVRVANGRAPSLSVCGVTSRYNRTAPLLFAAEGRQFVPLSRRNKGDVLTDGPLVDKPVWNDTLDLTLAQCVKDIDKEKWARVANEFNRRAGRNITAAAAALRHTLL